MRKVADEVIRLTVVVPVEMAERVRVTAWRHKMTVSSILRKLIEETFNSSVKSEEPAS